MHKLPVFAPLKKSSLNLSAHEVTALVTRALQLQHLSTEDLITHQENISVHDDEKLTLTRHLGLESYSVNHQLKSGLAVPGDYGSFRSLNLTYLPDWPHSKEQQFYTDPEGVKRAYLFTDKKNWNWRADLDLTCFKEVISDLFLERVDLVRLIYLLPPAVGGVHVDTSERSMQSYYEQDGISLTLNLLSGDGRLCFLRENSVYTVPEDLRAWHFNPSAPHSVGKVESTRIQLRIFGKLSSKSYLDRMDLTSAIW
jgi:hypothetical protein